MAKIRCGRGHYHNSIAEVRACYNGDTVTDVTPERSAEEPKATEKQLSFIESLLKQSDLQYKPGIGTLNRRTASQAINDLKSGAALSSPDYVPTGGFEEIDIPGLGTVPVKREAKASAFDPETLEDGFYMMDDKVYKVIVAVHGSGRKYAKQLDDKGRWQMSPGSVRLLRPENKMTLDQALEVAKHVATDVNGALYGRCFRCGRELTDEDSIERFMGPVCAAKF